MQRQHDWLTGHYGLCLTIDDRGYWFLERFAQEAKNGQAWLSYMKQTPYVVIDGESKFLSTVFTIPQSNPRNIGIDLLTSHIFIY